ncbi:3-phosphoglycerate dehydrogenase family protein [Companilactobacillus halodurans]|uniref:3-phosphoglycerate dehydrogenase n=1 Tax=Companilactobacillus halodurans TaxID=2584183 RepID=A0A5P0ZLN2_9LACO|nr:3-phosphoglycerate dehydrogenase family protein [Companilactobacillus halodurans]MQS75086.1 3-phosphoglycerate dehydrogenase [Companilactobacillus halodurans]MQS96845.1 3-phosphoglycerate dehydrogenase [Companilactobacillus halodurans]
MYQVKTFNAIAKSGLEIFTDDFQINQTDNPDAYLIRSVNLLNQNLPQNLKAIVRAGAGVNNVPLKQATKKGIAVFNTPGSNANAVKELVISLMIATTRNLFSANEYSIAHAQADISQRTEKDKTKFNGSELAAKKLAVIGLGHVGSLVANAAMQLGMKVIGFDPYLSTNGAWRIDNKVRRVDSIKKAVQNADFVTVHVPKNDATIDLIGTKEIDEMKENVILFNYSRLGIINNKAVVKALRHQKISHYCTDFGEPLIAGNSSITITPHIGGSTIEAESNGATQGAKTVMDYLESGDTKHCVNLPNLEVPFETEFRITVIHQNIPNMVGQISTQIANKKINIENMSNAAKGEIAYTIVDVDNLKTNDIDELKNALESVTEVYRVRIIKHQ